MASEDVIELGSSDDEAEPAPKKKKPLPNAMVHIPSKLPGVTIKQAKSTPPVSTGILGKPILIKKPNFTSTINRIIKPTPATIRLPINNKNLKINNSSVKSKVSINPYNIAKSLNQTEVVVKKVPSNKRLRNPIEIQGPKVLNNLPPGITIKPVHNADITISSVQKAGASGMSKKRRLNVPKQKPSGELLTVEIEDEDVTESATASLQWYLRPEDQIKKATEMRNDEANMEVDNVEPSMEAVNNKEPEVGKFVEIIVEDSPIKTVHSKHPDIGKELTITIEDSPVKPITKITKDVESDSDLNEIDDDKSPQSKKKLDYPKECRPNENHVVEIEIDLKESGSIELSEKTSKLESSNLKSNEESAPKQNIDAKKVNHSKESSSNDVIQINIEDNEFHPIYQKFICMCFQLENTNDMKKIVDKKIKAYYRQCSKDFVESEEFIDMVSSKIDSMKAAPEKMYLYIKDIVDELNVQRKMIKSTASSMVDVEKDYSIRAVTPPTSGSQSTQEPPSEKYEHSQYDSKKRRQIRKLEKTIKKLHRAIQKLEEQEVDFDDDEDSVYLLTERYKERMVRVHAKFCQLTNTKMPSEPRVRLEARLGRPAGPAKKLEKWINRKVPIGTPLPFPDFHDVLRCVRDANEEEKLGWNDIDIMEEARDLFTRCGRKLQRRRQENEWRIAASRISAELDPAENSSDLKQKLDENKTVAAKKETELLNKYVDRQNLLKLEAEEIGDKEAEESPVESEEEEDVIDDNAMEDKQKRKQRLKRLIEEKSKKDENKENDVKKDTEEKENIIDTKEESRIESKDVPEKLDKSIEDKSNETAIVVDSISNVTETTEDKNVESESAKEQQENDINSDSNKVESDIDELHLLQKLHSESEFNTSALESTDSDTPIAISDSLGSDSEVENGTKSCDIISIENSSYSESESTVDGLSKDNDTSSVSKKNVEELVNANFEIEYSSIGVEETNKEAPSNETVTEEIEGNILLGSSDEDDKDKAENLEIEDTCINLRDDNISISETMIDGGTVEEENTSNDENNSQENNNAVEIIEESPEAVENDGTVDMSQEDDSSCENTNPECSRVDEATIIESDSPKDIDDIRSTSDINSVESTDLQTTVENKEEENSENIESMNVTELNDNEKGVVTEEFIDGNAQDEHLVENEINDLSAIAETNCENSMEI